MQDYEQVLARILERQGICFLSSLTPAGYPKTRAMLLPCAREGALFYHHTNTSSSKVRDFRADARASLYFCDPLSFEGVLFCGEMTVVEEEFQKRRFWRDSYRVYYHEGPTDADYCLLRFEARSGEIYGNFEVEQFTIEP